MSAVKRIGQSISTLIAAWRRLGALTTLRWLPIRLGQKLGVGGPARWRAHPRQVRHDLIARLGGSSDMDAFCQVFIYEEYLPLRALANVSLVLDLGANAGYSSAYFLSCFPNSRVVAVEPDDRNMTISRVNLKPYGDRALLLHGAVW